jgi:putative hemolysin
MAETSRGARKALHLAEHPEGFLSAVQLWISLLSLLIGYFGGESMGARIAIPLRDIPLLAPYSDELGFATGFLVMLFLFGLVGELVPKRIGTLRPEQIASTVAYPMDFFAKAAKPVVLALSFCTRTVMRMMGLDRNNDSTITEEEIRMLVSESHEQGVIDSDERNMMHRVMRLGDRTADSMMTPRTRIAWLDASAPFAENLATMRETPYSRYPVYRGSDADVLGVLEVKTLLERLDQTAPDLFQTLRPAVFVSESTHALKLLEIFREEQQSLALVVDEYGDVAGMVTLNDLMGAVLGRVQSGESADAEARGRFTAGGRLAAGRRPARTARRAFPARRGRVRLPHRRGHGDRALRAHSACRGTFRMERMADRGRRPRRTAHRQAAAATRRRRAGRSRWRMTARPHDPAAFARSCRTMRSARPRNCCACATCYRGSAVARSACCC